MEKWQASNLPQVIKGMLIEDPKKRLNITQILNNEYFDDVRADGEIFPEITALLIFQNSPDIRGFHPRSPEQGPSQVQIKNVNLDFVIKYAENKNEFLLALHFLSKYYKIQKLDKYSYEWVRDLLPRACLLLSQIVCGNQYMQKTPSDIKLIKHIIHRCNYKIFGKFPIWDLTLDYYLSFGEGEELSQQLTKAYEKFELKIK